MSIGFFSRAKRLWVAFLNLFVTGLEDKYLIEIAEAELRSNTERLKEAREGLVAYQTLVSKVRQQVEDGERQVARLTAEIKSYLRAGERDTASKLALELSKAKEQLQSNQDQLGLHEKAYENNLVKMKDALGEIEKARLKLKEKEATLKMERALAEVAEVAGSLDAKFDVSTDIGEIMSRIDDKIFAARGRATVAADLSSQGVAEIQSKERMEKQMAEDMLRQFEMEEGLVSPPAQAAAEKTVGPMPEVTEKPVKEEA